MTIAVNDLIDDVEELLNDTDNDRWSASELISYLNSGQRDIAVRTVALKIRPAYIKTTPVKLVAGPKQSAPSDAIEILDITRNMGREWVTGTSYAKDDAVYNSSTRYICLEDHTAGTFATDLANNKWEASELVKNNDHIEQYQDEILDTYLGSWMNVDPDDDSLVLYWVPSNKDKKIFYVRPQQPNTDHLQYVEMIYAAIPSTVSAGDNISLGDEYKEALMDYIQYRALSKDDDIVPEGGIPKASLIFQVYLNNPVFNI